MNSRYLPKWLFGLALMVLLAGRAHSQATYTSTIDVATCPSANGQVNTQAHTNVSSITCGSQMVLLNMTTQSDATDPEPVGPCPYTLTVTVTDNASGQSKVLTYTGTIMGTLSHTLSTVTFQPVTAHDSQTFQLGCFTYTVGPLNVVDPAEQGAPAGSIGATLTCVAIPGPQITCPPNQALECPGNTDPSNTGMPTATGGCGAVTFSFTDTVENLDCTQPGHIKTRITRHWTATDSFSPPRTSSCDQIITIADTTAPTLSAPGGPMTIECPASPVFTPPTASDLCDPAPVLSFTDVTTDFDCTLPGHVKQTITRTWIATDSCGNVSAPVSQTITIADTMPPVIDCPAANITVNGNPAANCTASVPLNITATDNCDPDPVVTATVSVNGAPSVPLSTLADPAIPGNYLFPVGTSTVTVNAVDACGNTASVCTFTVTVNPCGTATRTQGFWATHVNALATALANGCFPNTACFVSPLTINELEAIFFAQIGQNCTGKRSALGQARLQLGQQLLAAYANCCVLGTCPTTFNLNDALAALNGTDINLIKSFIALADAFNNSGDAIALNPGQLTAVGPANPQLAKSLATKTANGCIDPGTCFN